MKKIKTLAALISASLTSNMQADQYTDAFQLASDNNINNNNNFSHNSVLNLSVSHRLAAHRSHSSHRSHRSSSGSGYSRPYSAPAPAYTVPTPQPKTPTYGIKGSTHDPLGQQARPSKSYPSTTKPKQTKEDIKNIIRQVQLALLLEGLYSGAVDGIMGPETRAAIKTFKRLHNIKSKALLGAKTLNALGVKGF